MGQSIQQGLNATNRVASSTDNTLPRFDGTTGAIQTTGVAIDDSDNVLLPTGSAFSWNSGNVQLDHSAGALTINGTGTSAGLNYLVIGYAADSTDANNLLFRKARGNIGTPTIVSSGDGVGKFFGQGYDGAAYQSAALITFEIDGTPGAGDMPGRIVLWTTPDGSAAAVEAVRIENTKRLLASGGIVSASPTAGVGYSTGAGGTVTQLTSKATGATLSKVCGTITTNNAALAAATIVSFTLTNTTIATGDVLVLNHVSGGTLGAYTINAACGAGSATITIRNNTAGSLSEAMVIRFALIKAVTA